MAFGHRHLPQGFGLQLEFQCQVLWNAEHQRSAVGQGSGLDWPQTGLPWVAELNGGVDVSDGFHAMGCVELGRP